MPSPDANASHPLPPGQVLYPIQDTTILYVRDGESNLRYQRASFNGPITDPMTDLTDTVDLGASDDILSARAVTLGEDGKSEVVILTAKELTTLMYEGKTSRVSPVRPKVNGGVWIIGIDPQTPPAPPIPDPRQHGNSPETDHSQPEADRRKLALLVKDAGLGVLLVDRQTGAFGEALPLPNVVRGDPLSAEWVRRGLEGMLVVLTVDNGTLLAHVIARSDLTPALEASQVTTLTLGIVSASPLPHVETHVTQMRAGTSDQQLAVAWPDTAGACHIALIGWESAGKAKLLATVAPTGEFPVRAGTALRLASADLLHKGVEQLALGYMALVETDPYNGMEAIGVYLMLFTLDELANLVLDKKSEKSYVMGVGRLPNADYDRSLGDMYLAAGMFGSFVGVQVIARTGSNKIECGFVPYDPFHGFSDLTPTFPACPELTFYGKYGLMINCHIPLSEEEKKLLDRIPESGFMGASKAQITEEMKQSKTSLGSVAVNPTRFFAFPSDLSGQSVVLGAPTLIQRSGRSQILAIIQAPPYDRRISHALPNITFATATADTTGCSVASNKSWNVSNDSGVNLGLGPLALSRSMHNSWGKSFDKLEDNSSSSNVNFHANFSDHDYLLVYAVSYNIWRYPIIRSSLNHEPGAEMLVIFPDSTTEEMDWVPAHQFAYKPKAEVGMLLSYVGVEKDGFEDANRIFKLKGITVAEANDSSSVGFEKSKSSSDTESKHSTVLNSITNHASFTGVTELFELLPAAFGLNIGKTEGYSESTVETTHITVADSLSLSVSSGAVSDPIYEYMMTPYIYTHKKLGCLVLSWKVSLTGQGWQQGYQGGDPKLASAQLALVRPVSNSTDFLYSRFTRAIAIVDKGDGTFDIGVEIFNNSLGTAKEVSCKIYEGQPEKTSKGIALPDVLLGEATVVGGLGPVGREWAYLRGKKLNKPAYVTIQLFLGAIPGEIYWSVYPPERFFGS